MELQLFQPTKKAALLAGNGPVLLPMERLLNQTANVDVRSAASSSYGTAGVPATLWHRP